MNEDVQKKGFIDRIIGDRFVGDANLQFRARVLISTWILFIFALMFFGVFIAFLPMKVEARLSASFLSCSLSSYIMILVFLFHKSGNYRLYAQISIALAFVSLCASVLLADKPIRSPGLGLFYVIPVWAVFFLGKKSGWVWTLLTVFCFCGFLILEKNNFPFLDFYDPQFVVETVFASHALGMVGISGMVFSYEIANTQLRQSRDFENARYDFLASHDELTGLGNRRKFENQILEAVSALGVLNKKEKLALLYLDLDGFKPINDHYGHKAGDLILKTVAARIQKLLNDYQGFAARHGGDEFLILLEHIQSNEELLEFLDGLLNVIGQPVEFEGQSLFISASVGVAIFPKHAQDVQALIRLADTAMYRAKEKKNAYSIYEEANFPG